jgi:hypothetical protein
MTNSTPSNDVDEVVRMAETSAVTLSALVLMLSSANACGDAFRAAVRQSDLAAATELAVVAASIVKILNDEPTPIPAPAPQRNETYRSVSVYGVEGGRPVVT